MQKIQNMACLNSRFTIENFIIFFFGMIVAKIFNHNAEVCESLNREVVKWSEIPAASMTGRQMIEYLKWKNFTSCEFINYFGGDFNDTTSFIDGQKAMCGGCAAGDVPFNCLVYSFGNNNQRSFHEAMDKYGCKVMAFDPSINASYHQHSDNLYFFQMGLGDHNTERNGWKLRTLSSIYKMMKPYHGKKIIDYLKIDIEGDEWGALQNIIDSGMLPKIRQLTVKVHLIPADQTIEFYRKRIEILQLLEAHGMVRFSSVANPAMHVQIHAFGFVDYPCHEIAWYNNYLYEYEETLEIIEEE